MHCAKQNYYTLGISNKALGELSSTVAFLGRHTVQREANISTFRAAHLWYPVVTTESFSECAHAKSQQTVNKHAFSSSKSLTDGSMQRQDLGSMSDDQALPRTDCCHMLSSDTQMDTDNADSRR